MSEPTNAQLAELLRRHADTMNKYLLEDTATYLRLAAQRLEGKISDRGIERGAIDLSGGPYCWDQLDEVARENFRERFRAALEAAREA